MATENKEIWIRTGYEIFALSGQRELKIERLAKKVGISKSSFYHHFADLDVFMEYLLAYHIEQSYIIAEKERNALKIDPDLIIILVDHRIDLLFNRQLRIHKNNEEFAETLIKSDKILGDAFRMVWARDINLELTESQLEGVFALTIENFYLQINEDNLNYSWLTAYFNRMKEITNKFL